MPVTTPQIKIAAVKARGAHVVLHGDSYDEAYHYARALGRRRRLAFVHPYDDPDVIAGQGTIAMEMLRQHPGAIHAIFVAIGGGGLISGIAAYVKRLRPGVKVIGVEPEDADAMYRSLKAGRRVRLAQVGLFAEGVAVKEVGRETFRLCRELVDDVIRVDTDAICAAIKDVFEDTRVVLEPAGALAIAGAKAWVERTGARGKTLVAVASGANVNFDRLRFIAEEAELGEKREAILAVTIPERPGSFREFCSLIGTRNITEFNYRYADPREAHVFVGVQVRDREETRRLVRKLRQRGLKSLDFSDNDLAKLHIRHTVGGHAPDVDNEILYRFEFPERPGALMKFLSAMRGDWNISLFHYRNHGADYGRVLVGMQVPPEDKRRFRAFLARVGYPCREETRNPAYKLFLG
jgi:threonine dehydratase